MYSWPISIHVYSQESPIRFQGQPHVPGPGKLAVQVKGVGLHRTHLHPANVEAFWPTMRHAIHFFGPLTQTATAREKDSDLSFFCTAPKPRTPRRIPSLRVVNCCRMSSTGKSSQSILSLPMSVGRFWGGHVGVQPLTGALYASSHASVFFFVSTICAEFLNVWCRELTNFQVR